MIKKYLNLNRNDPIHIDKIKDLEKHNKLKNWKINVSGDAVYNSMKEAKQEMNIILHDGHYTVNMKTNFKPIQHIYKNTNKFIIYNNNTYYDGKEMKEMTDDIRHKIFNNETQFTPVKFRHNKKTNITTMEEFYTYIISMHKQLKEESNGKINLLRTPRMTTAALKLYDEHQRSIVFEEIKQNEAEILELSTHGPIIYAKKYKGPAYKYDINQFYTSILMSVSFYIPTSSGKYVNLDN
jgi:hypothetical protein